MNRAVRSTLVEAVGVVLWCFGGQFLNRPWLVQVVDNCDFRQAPAVASELLAGAGTDELSKQDTDEQSTITEPAGGTCGLCVPSPHAIARTSVTYTLVYDIGRHITSNNGHGRYTRQDHIDQAGAWCVLVTWTRFCKILYHNFGALVLWWAFSEPVLVGPSGGQLPPTGARSGSSPRN